MKITITDDEGIVFAQHTLNGAASTAFLRLLDGEATAPEGWPTDEEEGDAREAFDDLCTAARTEARAVPA